MRLIFLMLAALSCSSPITKDLKQFEIKIVEGQSVKYDLSNYTYTVYFLSEKPYIVRFTLLEDDKKKILRLIYKCKLNKISRDVDYQDDCHIQPKIYTVVEIFNEKHFRLKINPDCDIFKAEPVYGKNIIEFIESVKEILKSKPEIANAPTSDIIYM